MINSVDKAKEIVNAHWKIIWNEAKGNRNWTIAKMLAHVTIDQLISYSKDQYEGEEDKFLLTVKDEIDKL